MEKENRTMLTDLYQLTMGASYFDNGMHEKPATFDMFVRSLPKDWGYYIANGIEDSLDIASSLRFEPDDLDYLRSLNMFNENYLSYLGKLRFEGTIHSLREGTPFAPNTPVMRVSGRLIEAQLLETSILNTVNFQTMISSKSNRMFNASNGAKLAEFGLRRAQEKDAGMKGARAAYLGGFGATSNVEAGQVYGIPVTGTHAHSFVMAFPEELDAFRAYAKTFPNSPTLLIDTYNVMQGARNAITVGKELEAQGKRLGAVRLDSGDICQDSKKVRQLLDQAGLNYVSIIASNDLNEYKIDEFVRQGAAINGYGVGTENITAKPTAAISGVYKLVQIGDQAKIKLAEGKKSHPGLKQIFRQTDPQGNYLYDILALENEQIPGTPLLEKALVRNQRLWLPRTLTETRTYALDCVAKLPETVKQVRVTESYQVRSSQALQNLEAKLVAEHQTKELVAA